MGVDPSAVVDGAVVIDSRAAGPGGLFVALPGEHVDGHDYVGTATAAGVTVVAHHRGRSRAARASSSTTPQAALGDAGPAVVGRLPDLTVIALTGSSGKTSTKDLIAQLIRPYGETVVAGGLVQQRDRAPAHRAAGDGAHEVPGRRDGCAAPGRHHLPGRDHAAEDRAGAERRHRRTSASSGPRTTSRVAKGELIEAVRAGRHRGAQRRRPRGSPRCASRTQQRVLTFGEAPEADVRADGREARRRGPARVHAAASATSAATSSCSSSASTTCRTRWPPLPSASAIGLTPEQIADGLERRHAGVRGADGADRARRTA